MSINSPNFLTVHLKYTLREIMASQVLLGQVHSHPITDKDPSVD